MNCRKVLFRLNAYLDGELPGDFKCEVEEHLKTCRACRTRAESMRSVGDRLDTLNVPPLPREFAARVMAEAQRRSLVGNECLPSISSRRWRPQWLLDLSVPMRFAACAMVLMACLLGLFMGKEVSLSEIHQPVAADTESLDGLEWFSPAPPATLGFAYLTLAWTSPDERGTP